MKKIIIVCICILTFCIVLAGCVGKNKTPNERKILSDYNEKYTSMNFANFNKVTIEKELTEENVYAADVVFTGEDDYADYQLKTSVYYVKYDNLGWVLEKRGFAANANLDYDCIRGRSAEDIKADIKENGSRYIKRGKNIEFVSSEFDQDKEVDYVKVTWEEEREDLLSTYEGTLKFTYDVYERKGEWIFDSLRTDSEKHDIENIENSVWRYKKNHMLKKNPYPDFIIKSISDDGRTLEAEYGDVAYVGKASEGETIEDGGVTYHFKEGGELKSAQLHFYTGTYFEELSEYVRLEYKIGCTDFHRVITNDIEENKDIEDGTYIIETKLSRDYVLDIFDSSKSSKANLQLGEKNGSVSQLFRVTKVDDEFYQIVNINSEKAIEVQNGEVFSGANVWQNEIKNTEAQLWKLVSANRGSYYIIGKGSGHYLDVENAYAAEGTNVKIFNRNDAYDAQRWYFIKQ